MLTLRSTDAFSGLETDETLNAAQIDQRAPWRWRLERARTVHLSVPATDLAYYYEAASKWRIEPIGYTAIVDRHALDPNALWTDFRVV
jgi:hypothetical protein